VGLAGLVVEERLEWALPVEPTREGVALACPGVGGPPGLQIVLASKIPLLVVGGRFIAASKFDFADARAVFRSLDMALDISEQAA
jgi:hypothetical protein